MHSRWRILQYGWTLALLASVRSWNAKLEEQKYDLSLVCDYHHAIMGKKLPPSDFWEKGMGGLLAVKTQKSLHPSS